MARLSGKDGAFTVAGAAVGVCEGWEFDTSAELLEATACGDDWKQRVALHKDWEARLSALFEVGATYNALIDSVGNEVAIVLKLVDTHTNGWISATGLLENVNPTLKFDEAIRAELTIRCNGTGPTVDTTPA